MTVRTIGGEEYRLGPFYKDGSRPYHGREHCQGRDPHPCPWHKPTRHSMRSFRRLIRFDKYGLVERVCEHGVGHPDPDSVAFIVSLRPDLADAVSTHGCDGCHG